MSVHTPAGHLRNVLQVLELAKARNIDSTGAGWIALDRDEQTAIDWRIRAALAQLEQPVDLTPLLRTHLRSAGVFHVPPPRRSRSVSAAIEHALASPRFTDVLVALVIVAIAAGAVLLAAGAP